MPEALLLCPNCPVGGSKSDGGKIKERRREENNEIREKHAAGSCIELMGFLIGT